jgi:subtilisin family serine protease
MKINFKKSSTEASTSPRSTWKWRVAALAFGLSAHGGAQGQPMLRYRDGAQWVTATRVAEKEQRSRAGHVLQPVRGTQAGRAFQAFIGSRALVQLSASASASWFQANDLRVVSARPRAAVPAPVALVPALAAAPTQRTTALAGVAQSSRAESAAWSAGLGIYLVEGRAGEDGLALASRLSQLPEVAAALPDLYLRRKRAGNLSIPPDDPRYGGQWYLKRVQIERAWKISAGDPATTIVVVDDGCDLDHPDLRDALLEGFDANGDDDDPSYSPRMSGNEHGTACAGIVAATGDNGIGIAGVCPRCTVRCVKLFDDSHSLVPISADIAAFDFAYDTGASVVTNSWGFAEPGPVPSLLRAAIERVIDGGRQGLGAVVVFAAGNENREVAADEIAAIRGVINVGAINNFDEAAPFSNFGESLTLTAPTGSLTTDISGPDGADPGDYTKLFGGTSSAAPVVAGVAALLLSASPESSAAEINQVLVATARAAPYAEPDPLGHDPLYGWGIVDPEAALRSLLDLPEDEPDADVDAGETGDSGTANEDASGGGCAVGRAARPSDGLGLLVGILLALGLIRRNGPASWW